MKQSLTGIRYGANRFSPKGFLKPLAIGVLGVAASSVSASAADTKPDYSRTITVPFSRTLGEAPTSKSQLWKKADELRKVGLQSDLGDVKKQLQLNRTLHNRFQQTDEADKRREVVIEALDDSSVFRRTTSRSMFYESYDRKADLDAHFKQVDAIETSQKTLAYLAEIKAGKVAISQETLDALNQEKEKASEAVEAAKTKLEEAEKHHDLWVNWTYMKGEPLSETNKPNYQIAKDLLSKAELALRQAQVVSGVANGKHMALKTLLDTPKEKRDEVLAKLQTRLETNVTQAKAAPKYFEAQLLAQLQQEYEGIEALKDKYMQLWKNPKTSQNTIVLTDDEVNRMARDIPQAIRTLEDTQIQFKQFEAQIQANTGADLRLPTQSHPNPWPQNFTIAAASEQQTSAFGNLYFNRLMGKIRQAGSMTKALQASSQEGLSNQLGGKTEGGKSSAVQVPHVSTQVVEGWAVGKSDKTRKLVVIVGGDNPEDNDRHLPVGQSIKNQLKGLFQLAESDITVLERPDNKIIAETFDQLAQTGGEDSEVMVVMTGHGHASYFDSGLKGLDRFKQGGYRGSFALQIDKYGLTSESLSETFMKTQLKKLKDYDCGVLLNLSCHSSAWIAKNSAKSTQDPWLLG